MIPEGYEIPEGYDVERSLLLLRKSRELADANPSPSFGQMGLELICRAEKSGLDSVKRNVFESLGAVFAELDAAQENDLTKEELIARIGGVFKAYLEAEAGK